MTTIQQQKKELRKKITELKKQQSEADKNYQSEIILTKVEQLNEFKTSKVVLLYWSMNDEVQTHSFIEKWWKLKTILLPVVDGENLKIRKYCGKDSMKAGEQFGILEPTGPDYLELEKIDLIIVPGVAFDKQNNRMGRGRGFYDKLLKGYNAKKIGICFDFQMVEQVPSETHDFKMDLVIK